MPNVLRCVGWSQPLPTHTHTRLYQYYLCKSSRSHSQSQQDMFLFLHLDRSLISIYFCFCYLFFASLFFNSTFIVHLACSHCHLSTLMPLSTNFNLQLNHVNHSFELPTYLAPPLRVYMDGFVRVETTKKTHLYHRNLCAFFQPVSI